MDRRLSLKWVLAASAAWPLLNREAVRADPAVEAAGYGTDPNLMRIFQPDELWPRVLTPAQRRLAGILSDLILPADEHSPGASAVGVVDFIDEWVSAPYPLHRQDRASVQEGFAWLDAEGRRRRALAFADLELPDQLAICDGLCDPSRAAPELAAPARFFARYRDLTAGGFYSSPAGRKDLNYIGNVPLARFEGPPPALLKALGLD
jgi:hypothetical protein